MATHKQVSFINIFFFFIFFLCNNTFAMELTEQQKNNSAQFFIQQFPHMTFAKTKTIFNTLQKPVQAIIWNKLEHDKDNKELSVALGLAHLPPEHQSLILTGTLEPSDKLKSKLQEKSIFKLFVKRAKVDQQCKNKNYLEVEDFRKGYHISIPKHILFTLTKKQITMLKSRITHVFTKEELLLFNDILNNLPNDIQEKLKSIYMNPYYESDYHGGSFKIESPIRFYYREGKLPINKKISALAKDALYACKNNLPYILPYTIIPLLYTYFFINPTWDSITKTQDPLLLEHNRKLQLTNNVINLLQQLNPDYVPHTITPVPFEYSWYDLYNLTKPLLPSTFIIQLSFICCGKSNGTSIGEVFWQSFIYLLGLTATAITSLLLYPLSKIIFSNGIPIGLTALVASISCCVILYGIANGIIDSYEWKYHSIDFKKGESIEQFLLNPESEIQ